MQNAAVNILSIALRTHLKTHSGEKSNICYQCNYAFSRADALGTHLKTHSGEKPNKCNQCDFASTQAGNLRTHLKTHHWRKLNSFNQYGFIFCVKSLSKTKKSMCLWTIVSNLHLLRYIWKDRSSANWIVVINIGLFNSEISVQLYSCDV